MATVPRNQPPAAAGDLEAWRRLTRLATVTPLLRSDELLRDSARCEALRIRTDGLFFDFSKQRIGLDALGALLQLAEERRWRRQAQALAAGEPLNSTENRAALHTALRSPPERRPVAVRNLVTQTLRRLLDLAEGVRQGRRRGFSGRAFTDVVHIGIGGSQLGPELATTALGGVDQPIRTCYLANIDGGAIGAALAGKDPETTLFIIASKSFTTLETQANAAAVRSWFLERSNRPDALAAHFLAVTANIEAAAAFGLPERNLFPLWDWVGGRFSLWSGVGLPIALQLGAAAFKDLLAGAHAMDRHFLEAPRQVNAPLLAALFDIWNGNFLDAGNLAVLPYDHRLRLLPNYLQQLVTESNGKRVRHRGAEVGVHTAPIVWGGEGTLSQHAFHQLLHQGTRAFTADFVLVGRADHELREQHRWLLANGLAQGQAMALGWRSEDPHRAAPGNHSVNTFVLDRLDPWHLGALLAFFEHRVFCQGLVWDINSFDQWGVEFGKGLARRIFDQLGDGAARRGDYASQALVAHLQTLNRTAADDDPSGE